MHKFAAIFMIALGPSSGALANSFTCVLNSGIDPEDVTSISVSTDESASITLQHGEGSRSGTVKHVELQGTYAFVAKLGPWMQGGEMLTDEKSEDLVAMTIGKDRRYVVVLGGGTYEGECD